MKAEARGNASSIYAPPAAGLVEEKAVLNAKDLVKMGFARSMAYQLLNRQDLPVIAIGGRKFMHGEKFRAWLANQAEGAERFRWEGR